MPTTELGKVSLTPKGIYNPTMQYETLDLVCNEQESASFVAVSPSVGKPLNDVHFWMALAKAVQGIQGEQGEQGIKGDKGDKGTPIHIAGSFGTLDELNTAYPNGDGDNSYTIGVVIYVWNGTAWNATGGISDYTDLTNKPLLNNVVLAGNTSLAQVGAQPAGDYPTQYEVDKQFVSNAFISCISTYSGITKRHTLTPTQIDITLPEIFNVRFVATAVFTQGDTVYIGGQDYTPTYTDNAALPVGTGWWTAGAAVSFICVKTTQRAYVGNSFSTQFDQLDYFKILDASAPPELHRTTFRGKNLGTSVTEEQEANIKNGSFKGLFLGDYWSIGGKTWRIADFNYWLNCGDTNFTRPHLVIMPDNRLYYHVMNDTNTTDGGYVGSKMYTEGLEQAKAMAESAFPGMVLTHRKYLVNAVTNGKPSGGAWYDSTVELPNEIMMYGSHIFAPQSDGITIVASYTINNSQLALMAAHPRFIKTRETYWLWDVVSAADFARVHTDSLAAYNGASFSFGVRPVYAIG